MTGPATGPARPDHPGTPAATAATDARTQPWPREDTRTPGDTGRPRGVSLRRGAADPVKVLMHRHQALCERAVDPLEIAAGLEAHGVTDRTAARFRHRDVFSLAEEMYARVPRDGDAPARARAAAAPRTGARWIPLGLLPGALCAAAVTGARLTEGRPRLLVAAAGVLAVVVAVHAVLRRGPLGIRRTVPRGPHTPGARTSTYWLAAYALLGDGLLGAAVAGGPDGLPDGTAAGPWPLTVAPVLALALACAPAAATAHLFAVGARRRLEASHGLEEFAASVRPLLLGSFVLFLCALTALTAACGAVLHEPAAYARTLALGALLLLARLLAAHGFHHAPVVGLGVAAGAEATAQASVFAARLPGCDVLAVPVDALVARWGPGSVQTLACGAAACLLLVHATRRLTRASAHAPAEAPS